MVGQHLWVQRHGVSGPASGSDGGFVRRDPTATNGNLPVLSSRFRGHDFSRIPVQAESQVGRSGMLIQHTAVTRQPPNVVPPAVYGVLQTPGEPLDDAAARTATLGGVPLDAPTRTAMEAGFGHDFSAVRVHADERAGDAAGSLHAAAFTIGTHVVFARGAYHPRTPGGLRLIAHELAHVVQQGGRIPEGSVTDHAGEHAADEAAQVIAAGGRAHISPLAATGPQRSPDRPPSVDPVRFPALTPEEMWTQLVQSKRGFESSSSGTGDAYRSSPATAPPGSLRVDQAGNPVAKGAPLGKGYETLASVQLVDADGNGAALTADLFDGGGPENHAEARCVRSLEADGPARLQGGKLIVVGDQSICPTCRQRLVNYAKSRGLTVIEPHEPVRPKMVGTGDATSKTTSRSSTQAGRPHLTVVPRDPIPVPSSALPPPHGAPPTPQVKSPAPEQRLAPRSVPPPEGQSAPAPRTERALREVPTLEQGVVRRGRVSVEAEVRAGRPRVRVTAIDTVGMVKDEAPQLSRTPKGSALATAMGAATIGRTLLDLYASASDDEATRRTIMWITHPVQSWLGSMISDAEKEFLATHPDPSTMTSGIDADRAVYEAEWRRLGAYRARGTIMEAGLQLLTPEDRHGPDWYAALEQARTGATAPPQAVQSFLAAARAFESHAIEVLEEIASYPLGLNQLADEIDQRARMLDTVAEELDKTFLDYTMKFPLAFYALLDLHFESQFVSGLAGGMSEFVRTVRGRNRAYVDLEEKLDVQLRQVEKQIDDPGSAIINAPFGPR
ncbi:hypothetical protein B5P43_17880 [Bacillus sp. SRB_336]|nr:hypothetical protein B5P43_17880 [Bacillus sp. SRB_336]